MVQTWIKNNGLPVQTAFKFRSKMLKYGSLTFTIRAMKMMPLDVQYLQNKKEEFTVPHFRNLSRQNLHAVFRT